MFGPGPILASEPRLEATVVGRGVLLDVGWPLGLRLVSSREGLLLHVTRQDLRAFKSLTRLHN